MRLLNMLSRKIALALGCAGLLFVMSAPPVFAAQAKSKKAPKSETKAEPSASNPVDLNTASEQQLIDLPGIGPALAKKIIANRPYSSASELSKASIPERTIKKITPMVTTGSATAAAPAKPSPTTSSKKADSASAPASESKAASEPSKSAKKSASEPQATQAAGGGNGKVWVNTKSGVYHKEGDRWYGRTKEGKYMTEDEANKAGYRLDKQDKKD